MDFGLGKRPRIESVFIKKQFRPKFESHMFNVLRPFGSDIPYLDAEALRVREGTYRESASNTEREIDRLR